MIDTRSMGLLKTLFYICNHPLNRSSPLSAIFRFIRWQVGCRILGGRRIVPWINGTKLIVGLGETGLTGNVYCGLHEFSDMSFLLHFLRATDTFVDVGANSGSYTVLAAGVGGCRVVSIEPVPFAYRRLIDNIQLNLLDSKVTCLNIGVGARENTLKFSADLDTMNHVLAEHEDSKHQVNVKVRPLDLIMPPDGAALLKIDVEGYETRVADGAAGTLSSRTTQAVIMELNGSGARYGFDEGDLHIRMTRFGFTPWRYSPFEREIIQIRGFNEPGGNTIYIKDPSFVRERLKSAAKFRVFDREI
jgi:FkbM family methyltransferase